MIICANRVRTVAALRTSAISNPTERRFQQMKHSHNAAMVRATSGVLEPVPITAMNMTAIAGTLSHIIWRRLQVMVTLSQ